VNAGLGNPIRSLIRWERHYDVRPPFLLCTQRIHDPLDSTREYNNIQYLVSPVLDNRGQRRSTDPVAIAAGHWEACYDGNRNRDEETLC
jgi:hypothetical protein